MASKKKSKPKPPATKPKTNETKKPLQNPQKTTNKMQREIQYRSCTFYPPECSASFQERCSDLLTSINIMVFRVTSYMARISKSHSLREQYASCFNIHTGVKNRSEKMEPWCLIGNWLTLKTLIHCGKSISNNNFFGRS